MWEGLIIFASRLPCRGVCRLMILPWKKTSTSKEKGIQLPQLFCSDHDSRYVALTGRSDSSDKVVQQIINCKLVGESRPSVVSIRRSVGLFLGTGRCRLRGLPKKVDKDRPDPPPIRHPEFPLFHNQ